MNTFFNHKYLGIVVLYTTYYRGKYNNKVRLHTIPTLIATFGVRAYGRD